MAQATPNFDAVTAQVELIVQRYRLPGAVLRISQDGREVYARSFGGYQLDTRVAIASATKWLSATVIARLVDQGQLHWDDRLDRYAPDVPADKAGLTLRQLFSMTSGLPGGDFFGGAPCLDDRRTTLEACARQILALPLVSTPGTTLDYGGNAMQVAGWMAERATGKEWNQLFREQLAQPLGLQQTDYGYLPGSNPGNPRIAGGAYSTAADYLALVQLHLDAGRHAGKRLLDRATVQEMRRRQTIGAQVLHTPFPEAAGYGIGHWIDNEDAQGHTLKASSPGAFGFAPWLDTRRNIAAVLVLDGVFGQMHEDYFALQDKVAAALDKDTASTPFADFGGLWWNPAESGSGYALDQRADHRLVAAWYTYDDLGAQQWLLAADGRWLAPDRWEGVLYRTRYLGIDAIRRGVDPAAVRTEAAGTVRLRFLDAQRAEFEFTLQGTQRQVVIQRVPF
jgi:CubicO group peptidase (beta-lactamase class C family)